MEAKFGSSNKRIKRLTSIKTKFFRRAAHFLTTKQMQKFWKS